MKTKRHTIASHDPLAQKLWAEGKSLKTIATALGLPSYAARCGGYFGVLDPTPQPLGIPPFSTFAGESAEQRAFRRFPITGHKPGRP